MSTGRGAFNCEDHGIPTTPPLHVWHTLVIAAAAALVTALLASASAPPGCGVWTAPEPRRTSQIPGLVVRSTTRPIPGKVAWFHQQDGVGVFSGMVLGLISRVASRIAASETVHTHVGHTCIAIQPLCIILYLPGVRANKVAHFVLYCFRAVLRVYRYELPWQVRYRGTGTSGTIVVYLVHAPGPVHWWVSSLGNCTSVPRL